jgi:archaeal preflagellin peptidase FlaK
LSEASYVLGAASAVALAGGFAVAAVQDIRTREVSDGLWQVLAVLGALLGGALLAPGGPLPLVVWVVVAALAIEHLVPWDDALGERHAGKVAAIELAAYAVAVAVVGGAAARWGVGPSAVPVAAVAVVVTVVLARVLFEVGVLYGGADAKALIVSGLLVPVLPVPLLFAPAVEAPLMAFLPFSVTLLTDAALASLVVPIVIGIRNVVRGEFSFPRGFTGYTLDVDELPRRFVWVRDPALGEDTLVDDADSSAEDTRRRSEIAQKLRDRGVRRVWVTPQLPFLVLLAVGAFAGLLFGNVLLDLFSVL